MPVAARAMSRENGQLLLTCEWDNHIPRFCGTESFSAGLDRSLRPAATKHHFIRGAQKKTVLGPKELKTRLTGAHFLYMQGSYQLGGS